MALAIRPLPVLEDAAADRFVKKANRALKTKTRLDLAKKKKAADRILENSRI